MKFDTNRKTSDFSRPTALPESDEQRRKWQEANREWWESHPMRYDWKEEIGCEEFSKEFFEEIDRRFFSNVWEFMPWEEVPFDPLIDFRSLGDKDVLEIGVGNGGHAGLLAQHARSFTGIDLTEYAVKSTSARMERFGYRANIIRMDAEAMDFEDDSFDYIWSWGVIHHSSNTRKILEEMRRVLRPGGRATTMVYYRGWWHYYFIHGFIRGVLMGRLLKTKSIHKTTQDYTDGAIARYYTATEWKNLVSEFFRVDQIMIYGSKHELIPLPGGHFKNKVMALIPNRLSALLTNRLRMGRFLVSRFTKAD